MVDQELTVYVDAFPTGPFRAVVVWERPSNRTRTLQVGADPKRRPLLRPGMFAKVELVTAGGGSLDHTPGSSRPARPATTFSSPKRARPMQTIR